MLTLVSYLALLVTVTSCGKDTQDVDARAPDSSLKPTTSEVTFSAALELVKAITGNDFQSVERLVRENSGFDLNQLLSDGETFLTYSIKNDFRELRDFLLSKNVNLEKPNVNGHTPLMVAVQSDRGQSVKLLLDLKVDTETKDPQGDTALHLSLKNKKNIPSLSLIKNGANLKTVDAMDRNAFVLAQEFKAGTEIQEYLKGLNNLELSMPDLHSYKKLLEAADFKLLEPLISKYPRIVTDYNSINPLLILAESPNGREAVLIAHRLLKYKVPVEGPDGAATTPLIRAVALGKRNFVHLFLSNGANVHAVDASGKTALIHAVIINRPDLVGMLVRSAVLTKYKVKVDGRKAQYDACEIAEALRPTYSSEKDLLDSQKVLNRLYCRSSSDGLFHPEDRD